jgi:transposase-like protein
MPKRYGKECHQAICDRLVAGERVSKVSDESGVSAGTLHRWKDQALVDAGFRPGTKSVEVDELSEGLLHPLVHLFRSAAPDKDGQTGWERPCPA